MCCFDVVAPEKMRTTLEIEEKVLQTAKEQMLKTFINNRPIIGASQPGEAPWPGQRFGSNRPDRASRRSVTRLYSFHAEEYGGLLPMQEHAFLSRGEALQMIGVEFSQDDVVIVIQAAGQCSFLHQFLETVCVRQPEDELVVVVLDPRPEIELPFLGVVGTVVELDTAERPVAGGAQMDRPGFQLEACLIVLLDRRRLDEALIGIQHLQV